MFETITANADRRDRGATPPSLRTSTVGVVVVSTENATDGAFAYTMFRYDDIDMEDE